MKYWKVIDVYSLCIFVSPTKYLRLLLALFLRENKVDFGEYLFFVVPVSVLYIYTYIHKDMTWWEDGMPIFYFIAYTDFFQSKE